MASKSSSTYVEWMWRSNWNPYSQDEEPEWSSYLEEECVMIERAYQAEKRHVYLKNHYIDFERNVQISIKDNTKQRPIKRLEHNKELWIKRRQKLGAGSFGTVYQGIYRESQDVAYKVIKRQLSQAAQHEANILKTLRHPNIVQYIDVIHTSQHTLLVMELIDGGTLFTYIQSTPKSPRYWRNTIDKMTDVAFAMSYLHEKNVVHADLKSDNILLRKNGTAVLSDFGLSKVIKDSEAYYNDAGRGALRWLAPELCQSDPERCSFASDIWAFGCVLIEIITSELPWQEFERTEKLMKALADERYASRFQQICRELRAPDKFRKILCACCTWSKDNRPSFEKIIRDLRSISDDDLEFSNQRPTSSYVSKPLSYRGQHSPPSSVSNMNNLFPNEPLYSDEDDENDSSSLPSQNYEYSSSSYSPTVASRRSVLHDQLSNKTYSSHPNYEDDD